jgi:hypothetical protein
VEKDSQPIVPQVEPPFAEPEPARTSTVDAGPASRTAAVPTVPPRSRSNGTRFLNLALIGAFVLAVGGIAFAAGRMTAPASTVTGANFPGGLPGNGQGNQGNGGFQGRPGGGAFGGLGGGATVEGTVESVSATTLTLKLADGQTIQVALNDSTTYHAQADASSSDVVTGGKVQVRLQLGGVDGGTGPSATAGTGGILNSATAGDVTVVP